jgi:formylmethanofuran dehydrogenase subunit C
MGALTFTLKETPPERLDLSDVRPSRLAGKALAEIERMPVGTSRTGVLIGDVFAVTGDDAGELVFEGGSDRFDNIGRSLSGGTIRVGGDVGQYLGRGMTAGRIDVEGSARGPYAGTVMTGGVILIRGDAAAATAASVPGYKMGMAGGLIVIEGTAGALLGDRMRRGVVVVLGAAGELTGARMIGGTIVAGSVGARTGEGMKRGTVIAGAAGGVEPTFVPAGIYDASFLAVLRRWLRTEAGNAAAGAVPNAARRYRGDMAAMGQGELLVGG